MAPSATRPPATQLEGPGNTASFSLSTPAVLLFPLCFLWSKSRGVLRGNSRRWIDADKRMHVPFAGHFSIFQKTFLVFLLGGFASSQDTRAHIFAVLLSRMDTAHSALPPRAALRVLLSVCCHQRT